MISFDLFEAFVEIQGDTAELAAGGVDFNQTSYCMRTRSKARRLQQQQVTPNLVEPPKDTMADNRTMAELLPGCPRGITRTQLLFLPKLKQQILRIKHGLLNSCPELASSSDDDKEDPHSGIDSKDLLRACPQHEDSRSFTNLIPFKQCLNVNDQDSLNSAAGGNFLDKRPADCSSIIESKSKVRNSRSKAIVAKVSTSASTSGVSPDVTELKDMVRALLLDKQTSPNSSSPLP
ncbi:hypothetical protein Tco_1312619 [Tanacetum coccineum]